MQGLPTYVIDSHALYWHICGLSQLSHTAESVLRLAEAGGAQVIVPAIVVAEVCSVARKLRRPVAAAEILGGIDRTPGYLFSPLGRLQLDRFDQATAVPEMHDRLIVADAMVHNATVITRDPVLQKCGLVPTIW